MGIVIDNINVACKMKIEYDLNQINSAKEKGNITLDHRCKLNEHKSVPKMATEYF